MRTLNRSWLVSGYALAGLALSCALGSWQLDRAAQKEALQAALQQRGTLAALDTAALLGLPDPMGQLHRPVQLRGNWLAQYTVFLDNRQMQGRPGFYVVTPLQLEGSAQTALVQRGWVARNFLDRASLPVLDTPAGSVTVTGRLAPPPAKLYAFGGAETGPIRQNLDLTQFAAELGRPVLAATIVQTHGPSDGLLRDWAVPGGGAEKNYGYAFQWFGLGALIAVLYVWFQIVRRFI